MLNHGFNSLNDRRVGKTEREVAPAPAGAPRPGNDASARRRNITARTLNIFRSCNVNIHFFF